MDDREVVTCLGYAAALGRTFELCQGTATPGCAVLDVRDPDLSVVVTVEGDDVRVDGGPAGADALRGSGSAVAVLEMLSASDAGQPVPAVDDHLIAGLAAVFDQADAG